MTLAVLSALRGGHLEMAATAVAGLPPVLMQQVLEGLPPAVRGIVMVAIATYWQRRRLLCPAAACGLALALAGRRALAPRGPVTHLRVAWRCLFAAARRCCLRRLAGPARNAPAPGLLEPRRAASPAAGAARAIWWRRPSTAGAGLIRRAGAACGPVSPRAGMRWPPAHALNTGRARPQQRAKPVSPLASNHRTAAQSTCPPGSPPRRSFSPLLFAAYVAGPPRAPHAAPHARRCPSAPLAAAGYSLLKTTPRACLALPALPCVSLKLPASFAARLACLVCRPRPAA